MSDQKNTGWYYVAYMPALFAITVIFLLTLISLLKLIEDTWLLTIIAFALAELTMIFSAFAGVGFLIDSTRTFRAKNLLMINIGLFFLSSFAGLILFLKL